LYNKKIEFKATLSLSLIMHQPTVKADEVPSTQVKYDDNLYHAALICTFWSGACRTRGL